MSGPLISVIVGVGLVVICLLILFTAYAVRRKRKHNSEARQRLPDDSICGPSYPILKGQTLHDIIELTTSGSGSGEF